ncbi:hypothetical protein vseg_000763 [Gypsophila vaccaria]
MATAFLKRQNLLAYSRHYISPKGQTQTQIYKQITTTGTLAHQQQGGSNVKHYSRLSNIFRRSGKAFEVPGSGVTGFSSWSSSSSSKVGLVGWYMGMIKARPVLTKSITSSLIYVVADFTSQTIALPSSEPYDFIRTLRMAGYGLVILGPSLHFWFNFISKVLPSRDLPTTAKKMALGQTVYGPFMNVIFFSLNAALQGEDGNEILARLKRDLIPTMLNGLMYWPLCDFITFRFTPVHLQPLVSNGFSYLWTIYITYMASLKKASE